MISHALAFFAGTLAGVLILAILAAGRDDETSRAPGPVTPPADPNDPEHEWHTI
jgi:hypothetical protein